MLIAIALGLTLLEPPPPAAAPASAGVAVEVAGPACAGPDLSSRIGANLARGEAGVSGEGWSARQELSELDDGSWQLSLQITPPQGETATRTFEDRKCETVLDAAAFVIAAAIDPTVPEPEPERVAAPPEPETAPPEPEPSPEPEAEPQPEPVTPPEPQPQPEPAAPQPEPPKRELSFAVRALGGVDGGALPGAGGALHGSFAFLFRRLRIELTATGRFPVEKSAEADPDASGRIGMWAVGARGCGSLLGGPRKIEIPLCVGFEAGEILAEGRGFAGAAEARVAWGAPVFAPSLVYLPIPRLGLVVGAELGIPLNRAALVIDGLETLHQVGPAFGRGFVGLEGRFP